MIQNEVSVEGIKSLCEGFEGMKSVKSFSLNLYAKDLRIEGAELLKKGL